VAGNVLHVREDGSRYENPISNFDTGQNKFVAVPIDLSIAKEQVFLTLYGTGVRNHSNLANVNVRIGGSDTQVTYAGAQGYFTGLDQINVLIPQTLLGKGETTLELVIDGKPSNRVKINIK
jgi:uncharacterized protein (TIGR03437 family)